GAMSESLASMIAAARSVANEVPPDAAREALDDGAVKLVVDVRELEEFREAMSRMPSTSPADSSRFVRIPRRPLPTRRSVPSARRVCSFTAPRARGAFAVRGADADRHGLRERRRAGGRAECVGRGRAAREAPV